MTEINPVKITSLPDATTITGDEYFPIVQAGQTRKVAISGAAHGLTQGFVTFAGMANLPNARNLKVSDYLGITDGGAGGDLTIGTTLQATIDALPLVFTSQGNETLELWGNVGAIPSAGSLDVNQATITAMKIGG